MGNTTDKTENQSKALKAGLHIVATPIGNRGDITLRALDTLKSVDCIFCEDTRVTGKLLSFYGIKKPLYVYNDHSDDGRREEIIRRILDGETLALVSDAGQPLISDPGYKLIQACREKDIYITSLPGANAPLTALQLSGLPSNQFAFLGFLPPKIAGREKALKPWKQAQATLIAFETASRLQDSLKTIRDVMGERSVCVARELTKLYEEVKTDSVSALMTYYDEKGPPKGEIVILIAGADGEVDDEKIRSLLRNLLETMSLKDAAKEAAENLGIPKRRAYDIGLELNKE